MNHEHLIHLQGIRKIFYADDVETWALDDIHLTIDQGEYVSISGPSGCGKSTLLSVMGLLNSSTEGKYFLNGAEVTGLEPSEQAHVRNREIGFIFQAFNLISHLSAAGNVELPLSYRKDLSRKQRQEMAVAALEQVGMSQRQKHFPAQLSGGQQQRVAIARALAGNPRVLLADEPTGNLDSENAQLVMDLLRSLHLQGSTIVMVTHDPRWVGHADREISLFDGKIVNDRSRHDETVIQTAGAVNLA
jgi:putative ABC transport system ATP-binding protein